MEIKFKRTYTIAAVLFAASILTASSVSSLIGRSAGALQQAEGAAGYDAAGYENVVYVYKNGELVAWAKNKVTDIGLNHTRDILMGRVGTGVSANVSILQLSTNTDAPLSTNTSCPNPITGNGLDVAAGTINIATGGIHGNYSVNKTWSATGSQAGIAKVCLHNSSTATGNITFATALLSSAVNVENGDELSVFYYIKFSSV